MDSVLGDNSGVDIMPDLLELMNLQFFGPGIDHVNVTVTNSNETEESNERVCQNKQSPLKAVKCLSTTAKWHFTAAKWHFSMAEAALYDS